MGSLSLGIGEMPGLPFFLDMFIGYFLGVETTFPGHGIGGLVDVGCAGVGLLCGLLLLGLLLVRALQVWEVVLRADVKVMLLVWRQ